MNARSSLLLCCLALLAESSWAAPPADRLAQLRQLMSASYVEGVDAELASSVLDPGDGALLLELLRDASFTRPDNVVAFLSFADAPGIAAALVTHYAVPDGNTIERERSRALVDFALTRRAHRGDAEAKAALFALGLDRSEVEHAPATAGPYSPTPLALAESQATIAAISATQHLGLTSRLTDETLDGVLAIAGNVVARADFDRDTSCCFYLERSGSVGSFGTDDDPLEVIDSQTELDQVLAIDSARVKIVRAINFCNGRVRANVLGCSPNPGTSIVLVRLTQPADEAVLWLHQLGRNAGLRVESDNPRNFMATPISATHRGVRAPQCDVLRNLTDGNGVTVSFEGTCLDSDTDGVQDRIDNCPTTANRGQSDVDLDGTGDLCELGSLERVLPPDQSLMVLDDPLEFTFTRGVETQIELQFSTDPEFGGRRRLVGTEFQFFSDNSFLPGLNFWQEVARLGLNGDPVFWRIRGRSEGSITTITPAPHRALELAEVEAVTITNPVPDCPPTGEGNCTFDDDFDGSSAEDPLIFPEIEWATNHNSRFKLVFAADEAITQGRVISGRNFSLRAAGFNVPSGTWKEIRRKIWQPADTTEPVPVYFRVEAQDALGRKSISSVGRFFIADLDPPVR